MDDHISAESPSICSKWPNVTGLLNWDASVETTNDIACGRMLDPPDELIRSWDPRCVYLIHGLALYF